MISFTTPDGRRLVIPELDHSDLVLMWWREIYPPPWRSLPDLWFEAEVTTSLSC